MQQFLEAVAIALQAIWANKLRSFLTVIGNVVAVTSIIAVVSLVQGLNSAVEDEIQSQFAADSFSIQRRPLTLTDEENLRAESNPRLSFDDADAIREWGTASRAALHSTDRGPTRTHRLERVTFQLAGRRPGGGVHSHLDAAGCGGSRHGHRRARGGLQRGGGGEDRHHQ